MAKRRTVSWSDTIFHVERIQGPLYKHLYQRLREAIVNGQVEAGSRLPSTRALAALLGVSRNTTALAYQLLLLEGYTESRVGDGTRVARISTALRSSAGASAATRKPDAGEVVVNASEISQRGSVLLQGQYNGPLDPGISLTDGSAFRAGLPDLQHFPFALWARLVARRARGSLSGVAGYQSAAGYIPLRESIASQIGITRGVLCSPEQIIMTSGSQGALDLAARVLLDSGDAAWVEDPGYPGARGALMASGARLIPVPVDREGIDVEAGRRLRATARLASVTPSHQFPSGVTMSLGRRLALLAWAAEIGGWILEDDYDSEFRFSGRPLEALHGLDGGQRVLYIGSFSKVLFPALRLGYLVVPPSLVPAMLATRRVIDMHPPLLEQMALYDFLAEGHFSRHLRRMRRLYGLRRNAVIEQLQRKLGNMLELTVPEAGMHLVAWLPDGLDDREVAARAASSGLHVAAISQYSLVKPIRGGLLLGYAGTSLEEILAGVEKLAAVMS